MPYTDQYSSAHVQFSSSSVTSLPLLSYDAVATSAYLQQFSAVRQLTNGVRQRKPRHPKRPQFSPGEAGPPTQRIVKDVLKINRNFPIITMHENSIDKLLSKQTAELDKLI